MIYYPLSNNSFTDGEYYVASAQLVTLQNLADFIINLNFFILPRMGYWKGISELLKRCCRCISGRQVLVENDSTSTSRTGSTETIILRKSISANTSQGVELNEPLLESKSEFYEDFLECKLNFHPELRNIKITS